MPARTVMLGVLYTHDRWDEYWEGTLERSNGNIGTMTTRSVTVVGAYAITGRLGVFATLPWIATEASEGTFQGMSGIQDVTIAAKYRLGAAESPRLGVVTAFATGQFAVPVSDYTPDYFPFSIGTAGVRANGRLTVGYRSRSVWFAEASTAYTWCNNVTLDRDAYYADGRLYATNEVAMPNVLDWSVRGGVQRGRLRVPVTLVQQRTLGGGDIRRNDMPFVANRMDFTRLDASVMYTLRVPANLTLRAGAARVLEGRNVGASTTFTMGLFHAFRL